MPWAAALNERVRFAERADVTDAYGNVQANWQDRFDRAAQYIMRPGSETVLAARLEGRQPVTIIVRRDSETRQIAADWRATDLRTGKVWAIRAADDMDRERKWISIVAEAGATA